MHRSKRGKQHKYQLNYQNIPYQNQNFISISRSNHSSKTIIALAAKNRDKTNIIVHLDEGVRGKRKQQTRSRKETSANTFSTEIMSPQE